MEAKTAIKRITNLVGDCPEIGTYFPRRGDNEELPKNLEVACDLLKVQDKVLTEIYKICWEVK